MSSFMEKMMKTMTGTCTTSCMQPVNMDLSSMVRSVTVKKDSVTFFGTVYDANGAHPDPKKVDAIHKMPPPDNKQQLQHFLGMVTYLSPFIASLSTHTAPL